MLPDEHSIPYKDRRKYGCKRVSREARVRMARDPRVSEIDSHSRLPITCRYSTKANAIRLPLRFDLPPPVAPLVQLLIRY